MLLKAAKLDPSNAEAFEWLGHWYSHVSKDRERARGCFVRAVKLNPGLQGAGEALGALYLQSGQETLALALFRQCAEASLSCHWAWAGLGRCEMFKGELAEAAEKLQQVGLDSCCKTIKALKETSSDWGFFLELLLVWVMFVLGLGLG
ncbi:unnamed protein product [Discosporangium mesarthrocarpum]